MKLTIITVNLNNSTGLERTIQSVVSQTYSGFEYIIIDGASTDGSVEVIKKYAKRITYWISEKDDGIYNAMNKGILKAKGEYCLFIDSGDFFIKSTILNEMMNYIDGEDILYGNGFFQALGNKLDKLECPERIKLSFFVFYSLFHPATLIKKSLFDKYGLYNESNRIVSDGEFFIKAIIIEKVKTKLMPMEIAIAEDNGVSRNIEYKTILEDERRRMFSIYFPPYVIDLMNDYRDLKLENMKLTYEKKLLSYEIDSYKKNKLFRATLKMLRLLNQLFYTS